MWLYQKKLEYPVKIKNSNPFAAKIIVSQLGGPDGELGAATRYLNQRFSMPDNRVVGILTDIGISVCQLFTYIEAIMLLLKRKRCEILRKYRKSIKYTENIIYKRKKVL